MLNTEKLTQRTAAAHNIYTYAKKNAHPHIYYGLTYTATQLSAYVKKRRKIKIKQF